jgi:hypothetical protein
MSSVVSCFGWWTNQIGQLRKEKNVKAVRTPPSPPLPPQKNKLIILTLYTGISAPVYNGGISPGQKWWWTVLEIEISCGQWEGSV